MKRLFLFAGSAIALLSMQAATAQQPSPAMVVVAAANTPPAPAASKPMPVVAATANSTSIQSAVKALQQVKAANDETLKRQEATLQQLDDLQKAVEQLKIFAKRG